jgi:hypothetical protein
MKIIIYKEPKSCFSYQKEINKILPKQFIRPKVDKQLYLSVNSLPEIDKGKMYYYISIHPNSLCDKILGFVRLTVKDVMDKNTVEKVKKQIKKKLGVKNEKNNSNNNGYNTYWWC